MEPVSVVNAVEKIDAYVRGLEFIKEIIENKPYGIVHRSAPVTYMGKKGRLVWDYILYNELTFEDAENGNKLSLATSINDAEIQEIFDELVSRYGD